MAPVAIRGRIHDGPISKFVHNILVYLCVKFGAFMKRCTIGLISCRTNYSEIHRNRNFWSYSEGIVQCNGGMIVTSRDKSKCDISNLRSSD